MTGCRHCGQPVPDGREDTFCCSGCAAAYAMINGMGLGGYYDRRTLDPDAPSLRPDTTDTPETTDLGEFVKKDDGLCTLHLMVDGLHCASCVWLIENILARMDNVTHARINMSTRRLVLKWQGDTAYGNTLVARVKQLGYRLMPYDPDLLEKADAAETSFLLRCMGVAGFAAGNIMLISIALWSDTGGEMGAGTVDFFHWLSALIGLPVLVYAGRPFFRSAIAALSAGRANMDVPISLAILLTGAISLYETATGGDHIYFESAVMLVFFLLAGRYLDARARGRAREAAHGMLGLMSGSATVLENGQPRVLPVARLMEGMELLVPAGGRISADGVVLDGESELDTSLITGETLPRPAMPDDPVFAGTLNLGAPLRIRITGAQDNTLLADIVRLMENAEQASSGYVRIADRAARMYTPVVHTLGAATFLGWWWLGGAAWQDALLTGITVLIITCPCALGLAVPVVQVLAAGGLMKRGVLLKSGDALERLAAADTVVFDKTGTLTLGRPELTNRDSVSADDLSLAASLAAQSAHPLSRAVMRAAGQCTLSETTVTEVPGCGLETRIGGQPVRLGRAAWCGITGDNRQADDRLELWLTRGARPPVRLAFADTLRPDAAETVAGLKAAGLKVMLLSGDRPGPVAQIARAAGIDDATPDLRPDEKCAVLERLSAQGRKVLMVGDGLNDAPALAAAHVSMSPSSAMDITRNAADIIFQGDRLAPVAQTRRMAVRAQRLTRQNLFLAVAYNILAIPVAMAGLVTPLIAAAAMSGSSLLVVVNALRLKITGKRDRSMA